MLGLKVEICEYVDDWQPGWVRCRLIDAYGKEWLFVEKAPVVSSLPINVKSAFPQQGVIACALVDRKMLNQREIITVDTSKPWGIESSTGNTIFEVFLEQTVEAEGSTYTK